MPTAFVHPDEIRRQFALAMSDMYRQEVPQYGTLLELVRQVNAAKLAEDPALKARLHAAGELERLDVERHGAIRLGTAQELYNIRRMFGVMGMRPVGYYDLSVAGLPVHSTAFRPVESAALKRNPFRVFTSLLRLELVQDRALASQAQAILDERQIITPRALALIHQAEADSGLSAAGSQEFIQQALHTFCWHSTAGVTAATYARLHQAHSLIADVISFPAPHINHLTPRTLDIDEVQRRMPLCGITPKAVIEGPPHRQAGILLRQTSFKALEEPVHFMDDVAGTHTARFGEIEQRGAALTPRGRQLYDQTLARVRQAFGVDGQGGGSTAYTQALGEQFAVFPDSFDALRKQELAFFCYRAAPHARVTGRAASVQALLASGALIADAQLYEDFLPVSAAGIFQSNLGTDAQSNYVQHANRKAFEAALGCTIMDEMELYASNQASSLRQALEALGQGHLVE